MNKVKPIDSKDKYWICPICGDLRTEKERLEDLQMDLEGCYCEYINPVYSFSENNFIKIYTHKINGWVEIPKELYYRLYIELNNTIRLRFYKAYLKSKYIKESNEKLEKK